MQDAKIEVVRLHRFESGGPVKAFCDLQFGADFVVKGFRLIDGKEGLFVGMPSGVGKNGKWYETFSPISEEVRTRIHETIVTAYEE